MNVKSFQTTDYDDFCRFELGKNKANSNPIKANFRKAKMNVNSLITKDYRKKDDFAVQKNKPNLNPIQTQTKPISKTEGRRQKTGIAGKYCRQGLYLIQ